MRTAITSIVLWLVLAASIAAAPTKNATLHVEGMTCGACATSVKIVLKKIDGVIDATVSYERKRAVVQYDPDRVFLRRQHAHP